MFSRKHRIGKKLFENIFVSGKVIKTKFFLLKYCENEQGLIRVSVVASKKLFKTAVLRNNIKRRFREVLKKTELLNTNKDLIFILNKNIEKIDKQELTLLINQIRLK